MTRLLAVDPGVTTGYCAAELTDAGLTLRPRQEIDDVDDFWNRLEDFEPRYIICEDFEYRNKSRTGLVLFSVQLIGVANLYSAKATQCATILQKAAQGKAFYTDAQLKNLGVYTRGVPHAMDATRHLLQWITFGSGYHLIEGKQIKDLLV